MNLLLNPCRCQCEKQITKSQLIVIVKRNELQKRGSNEIQKSQNKIGAIAMEPKSLNIRRQSLFRAKLSQQVDLNGLRPQLFDQAPQNLNKQIDSKNYENNLSDETTLLKFQQPQDISKPKALDKSKNERGMKDKLFSGQIEEETYRKTMKKHKNPPLEFKDQTKDLLLTTKRCKKKYHVLSPPPESNKEDLSLIEQVPKQKFQKQKGKQKLKANNKAILEYENQNDSNQKAINLMVDEIGLLKMQLKRLQEDEKRLVKEKDQNQKFFDEDYAINLNKKEKLKKNCQERYRQINDLKKLLLQCKSRAI